jgi:mRNA interferase HigB
VIVVGTDVVERYFVARGGHKGIKAARAQYDAWRAIVETAQWNTPEEVKGSYPTGQHPQSQPRCFQHQGK